MTYNFFFNNNKFRSFSLFIPLSILFFMCSFFFLFYVFYENLCVLEYEINLLYSLSLLPVRRESWFDERGDLMVFRRHGPVRMPKVKTFVMDCHLRAHAPYILPAISNCSNKSLFAITQKFMCTYACTLHIYCTYQCDFFYFINNNLFY